MKTYTYFFYSHETGLTKIGRSMWPPTRFKGLGGRTRLTVIRIVAIDIERNQHNKYEEFREHGEWFRLPASELRSLRKEKGYRLLPWRRRPRIAQCHKTPTN